MAKLTKNKINMAKLIKMNKYFMVKPIVVKLEMVKLPKNKINMVKLTNE
jgi:hypothetical protein